MAGIKNYSSTASNNTSVGGVSIAEGMLPSNINNAFRAVAADIREWYNDSQWVIYGDGDGAHTFAYASGTSFTVAGANVTTIYETNRRVKAVGSSTGTIYGTISSSSFSTNTTVNVTWDSGNLVSETLVIYIAALSVTGSSIPPNVLIPADNSITSAKIQNGGVTADDLATDAVTTIKITDANVTTAKIAADAVDGTKIADDSINSEHYVDGSIDTAHIADSQVTTAKIADDAITAAKIADAVLVTASEHASHTPDEVTLLTTAASDARYFRQDSNETITAGVTWSSGDTHVATTQAIDNRIIDLVDDVGGFVPIANETSFPNANPDVNNAAGTIVSVTTLGSTHTANGSGVVSISNGTVGNSTVTLNGCGASASLPAGFGILVETTSTLNTYTFVRLIPKATEVTTVAGISSAISAVNSNATNINAVNSNSSNINTVAGIASNVTTVANNDSNITAVAGDATDIGTVATDLAGSDNIGAVAGAITNVNNVGGSITNVNTVATNIASVNNFSEVYRIASSAPTSSLNAGDLYFDTTSDTLKVYGGSGWQNAGSSVNGTSARFKYVATSNQTTFSGSDADGNTLAYDSGFIDVYLNGVHLDPTDYTATSGSSVVLASGAATGDILYIVGFGTFNVAAVAGSAINSGTINDARLPTTMAGKTLTTANVTTVYNGLVASGDGSSNAGQIQLNCHANTHGVKIKSPPHSAGQSYTLTLPSSITNGYYLKTDGSGNLSFAEAVADDSITTAKIAADAITGAKVADDAINSEHITDGSVDNVHLAGSIANAKLANSAITINGSSVALGASTTIETGTSWQSSIVTASTLNAAVGNGYWIDTTSNACTITLPGTASVGDTIEFSDYARTWGTNAVTLNQNSLNFQGNTSPNPKYNTSGQSIRIVYSGATKGWIPSVDDDVTFETQQPTLTGVTGSVFVGITSNLTLAGTLFGTANLVVNLVNSADSINENVTVTPSSTTAATVAIPAAVYNNISNGNPLTVKVTNADGGVSGTQNTGNALTLPTGGTISSAGGYRYHAFTSSGNFVNSIASLTTEYIIVAGAGGGGRRHGGGGGAGGLLSGSSSLSAQTYAIVIGGGAAGATSDTTTGNAGDNTTALGLTANGGGAGASDNGNPGGRNNGGSGGGGSYNFGGGSGTSGQGNSGGSASSGGGGGGGKGGSGSNASGSNGGAGGAGQQHTAYATATSTGDNEYYAGGGGGGSAPGGGSGGSGGSGGGGSGATNSATAGDANTGGGGGGTGNSVNGAQGGSGIVILRYQV